MVAMFRMIECLLELHAREVRAQATMKKPFPMAAFRNAAFAIEHVALTGLAPWAVRLLLPFAYPAVCAAHADLLFVHSFHPFNCHNVEFTGGVERNRNAGRVQALVGLVNRCPSVSTCHRATGAPNAIACRFARLGPFLSVT